MKKIIIFLTVCRVTKVTEISQRKVNCRMTSNAVHKARTILGKENLSCDT